MKITSSAFSHGEFIPSKYTCNGQNTNPPIEILDTPPNTKSLVLIMDDPDVPPHIRKERMWDHWILFNISPQTKHIPENYDTKIGVSGIGTSGNLGYHGPCPPDTIHRYFFKLYALDTKLNLKEGTTKEEINKVMEGHIIQKSELVGLYEQKNSN